VPDFQHGIAIPVSQHHAKKILQHPTAKRRENPTILEQVVKYRIELNVNQKGESTLATLTTAPLHREMEDR